MILLVARARQPWLCTLAEHSFGDSRYRDGVILTIARVAGETARLFTAFGDRF